MPTKEDFVSVRGAREHNLKDVTLSLFPLTRAGYSIKCQCLMKVFEVTEKSMVPDGRQPGTAKI